MERLKLSTGEQIEVMNGASENCVMVEVLSQEAFLQLYNMFTDYNLSKITFLNESGNEMAIYSNKILDKAELQSVKDEETGELKLIATFILKDIDTTKQKLKELQETVDTLVLNTLGINIASTVEEEEGEEDEADIDETIQE